MYRYPTFRDGMSLELVELMFSDCLDVLSGSISLVDLAGSERYEDGNSVDRRKETMCINKSLSSLANVIMALKQKVCNIS